MFKFKRKDKLAPTIGMYFWYGSQDNIFKVIRLDEHKCYFAWRSETTGKLLKTGGTYHEVFKKAILDETYHLMTEEEYYRIPPILREFKEKEKK